MAQKGFPFTNNGTGDGTSGGYTALEWSTIWNDWFGVSGVLRGINNELAVTGTSSPLAVNTGTAIVRGKTYRNTASVNLTVTTPVVNTTGGHVILELDWVAQTVRLSAIRNTDGINSTPSLTQSDSTVWQERLYSFTITTGGVITLTDARTYAYFSTKVKTAMLDDLAVTTAKINDAAVTTVKIADSNVTTAKIADSNVTTAKIADSNVTTAKIADANVTTAKIADGNVTADKLAAAVAGNGLSGGAGSALAVNVDNSTVEITADTLNVKAGGIGTTQLANDSVDDTKVGDRVAQFYRRQGGSASNWSTGGTSTQTPGAIRVQWGVIDLGNLGAGSGGTGNVTFPTAFSDVPFVMITGTPYKVQASHNRSGTNLPTASGFSYEYSNDGGSAQASRLLWLAFGPE